MIIVKRFAIPPSSELIRLAECSCLLYNKCNYIIRNQFFRNREGGDRFPLPHIGELWNQVSREDFCINLHNTKTAKQTIRRCINDWSNYFKACKAFQRSPESFVRKPKPPGYKSRRSQVTYYTETLKAKALREGVIEPTNGCFRVHAGLSKILQVTVTPKKFGFVVDVQYDDGNEPEKNKGDGFAFIDLGVNNLAAITSDKFDPILVNGRIVKSINRNYNKHMCKRTLQKRYWRLENYFHNASKRIVELCYQNNVSTVVIGKNDGWKQGKRMGKKSRQNFRSIPFTTLIQKITYKARQKGMSVIFTEESYTSKASFKDRESMSPEGEHKGNRVKRGLFRNNDGSLINADVNGSLNIGRKVIGNAIYDGRFDMSLAARPERWNPLNPARPRVSVRVPILQSE